MTDNVGLVVVQIDGLSRPELDRLLAMGRMPVVAGLIDAGRLSVGDWQPLLPPCTPASQAGILHGRNDEIPGFRWFEKESNRLFVANHVSDAAEIERRTSGGDGLLAEGGVSIGNLLAGDAAFSHLTMATIEGGIDPSRDGEVGRDGHDRGRRDSVRFTIDPRIWGAIFVDTFRELLAEIRGARRQRRDNVRPRMRRGWRYVLERVLTNVPLRILSAELVRAEIRRGRRLIYVDFTGYDEIAHHCGPGRPEAWRAAARIDESLGRIVDAIDRSASPYGLVLLSDHGQSLGTTYRQRFGRGLAEHIRVLIGEGSYHGATDHSEYDDGLVRLAHHVLGRRLAAAIGGLLERRPGTNHHRISRVVDSRGAPLAAPADVENADVVVCASGNLGLVYLKALPGQADRAEIERRYPGLIDKLVADPGLDVVVVRSERGVEAIGDVGRRVLDEGVVERRDPLAPFGPLAAESLQRLAGFKTSGDLIAIGHLDPRTQQVISFEELVGSHGGLGGAQEQPFFAAPPQWPRLEATLVGAPAIHRQLSAWLDALPSLPMSGAADATKARTISAGDASAPAPAGRAAGSSRRWASGRSRSHPSRRAGAASRSPSPPSRGPAAPGRRTTRPASAD
jgi:type I phosphodiesterase/nucleotide pyrophosphatase